MGIESEHRLPLSDSGRHKALLADVTYSNKLSLEEAPEHARLSRMLKELGFEVQESDL
jgi:hypothetical protein